MHADNAVIELAATAEPLSSGADGMAAALDGRGFVQAADGQRMGVLAANQALALVAHLGLLPLD
jgi:hypothetical protein